MAAGLGRNIKLLDAGKKISIRIWNPTGGYKTSSFRKRNLYKKEWVIEKIKNEALAFEKRKEKPVVAAMGLSFKPNIDDLPEGSCA